MSSDTVLKLLTLFDASEEAEALLNVLRNAGMVVRDTRVEDEEDMTAALEENTFDLVLAKYEIPLINARQVLEVTDRLGRDLPVVVVTGDKGEQSCTEIMQLGARDCVPLNQPERLRHVMAREFEDLQNRRALRRAEIMLHETEKRARALIDSSRDAIAYVHEGMHIYANKAYLDTFGYEDMEDVEGMPIMDMVTAEDSPKLKEFLKNYSKGNTEEQTLDIAAKNAEGEAFDITMEFSPASMDGEACTQIIIRNQVASKELEQKLNALSKQDLLTGLYNRAYLMEQLDLLISRAMDGSVQGALLFILLDRYDEIKQAHGIAGSDLLLTDIATLLKEKLGHLGVLAHFEGPGYALLIQKIDNKKAEQVAAGICKLINDHISDIGEKTATTTASIGISMVNETTKRATDVVSYAERGSRLAHKEGGNRFSLYSPAIEDLEENEQLSARAAQIKAALKANRFTLAFQPVVSLHGEPGELYEVLVRMVDDKKQLVLPEDFMPAAEKADLTRFIDRWVITRAFMVLNERHKEGLKSRLFIKLSAGSLCDEEFLTWLAERLKAARIDADSLIFEINEETGLNFMKQAKTVVAGLKQLHARTALEGFGLEQNTFQSLKHLDVDYVKIHGDLIRNLSTNVENQEKVKNIAETASSQGKQSIAAFVEDANSLAVLWQCSVDFIQGHFLQQPATELSYDFEGGI